MRLTGKLIEEAVAETAGGYGEAALGVTERTGAQAAQIARAQAGVPYQVSGSGKK